MDVKESKGQTASFRQRIAELEDALAECRRKQDILHESEKLYRLLAEHSSDFIWTMNIDGRFSYVSPSVTALTGYSPEEIMKIPVQEHIVPEYVPYLTGEITGQLKKPPEERAQPMVLEVQQYASDKSIIDVEVTCSWIFNEAGRAAGIQGSTRDIRKRKKAIKDLEESEARYRSLFERSVDMVYLHDFNGTFIDANSAALKAIGYSREEVTSITLPDLMVEEERSIHKEIFKELVETGELGSLRELTLRKKDGSFMVVEIMATVLYRNRKPYAVQGIARDVTRRKKFEDDLLRHDEKLQEMVNERMAELKEINKKLIHEIFVRKQIENELRDSENRLREHNENMLRELESARLIQKAIMPRVIPAYESLKIGYRYSPLEAVGGDFFSFTLLDEGGLGLFIGDVTGHGVAAALFLSLVRSITNQACRQYGLSPGRYIEMINSEVYRGMPDYYLTALYALLKRQDDSIRLTFARGGHPYPVLYRRATDSVELLKSRGKLLGWSEESKFSDESVELKRGDRVFFYTDGIPDTINTEREMLDDAGIFLSLFKDPDNLPLEKKLDDIMARVAHFRGGAPIEDDMVIIGIEVS